MDAELTFKKYKWVGPYSYEEDGEADMISPHTRSNMLSDLPLEDFVNQTWVVDDLDSQDTRDFIEFWRRVREFERQKL